MHSFYSTEISSAQCILSDDEAQHCVKVLRQKIGDEIEVLDGKGKKFLCRIVEIKRNEVRAEIFKTQEQKQTYSLHLAVAPMKQHEKLEWLIEKATEIGITEFTPLICVHSERKTIKKKRLERIAVSAMKQSLRFFLPKINQEISFLDFISSVKASQKRIAYCGEEFSKIEISQINPSNDSLICIGPEGDFTKEEVEESLTKNFQCVSLGENRLRSETAALVAVTLMKNA